MNQILITGTGCCGTGFMAKFLTSAGVNCTHEGIFNLRSWEEIRKDWLLRQANPEWGWWASSSWLAIPFLGEPELQDATVVQLVRHPKKVMDSHLRFMLYSPPARDRYLRWMYEYYPELAAYERVEDRVAMWYVRLNEIAELYADHFHRIEDDPRQLLDKLGIDYAGRTLYSNTSYNTHIGYGPSDVQLCDIDPELRDKLLRMAERYGYDWNSVGPRWVTGTLYDDIKVKVAETAAAMGGSWQMRDTENRPIAYDPALIKFFAEKVMAVTKASVIDVGANTGSFSMLPLVTDCHVDAFEANPIAARSLRTNLKLNNLEDDVAVHEVALSDYTGESELLIPNPAVWAAVACLSDGTPRPRDIEWHSIPVKVSTLDEFGLAPDFIKIDVEGAELAVLRGAEHTITQYHPGILTEYTSLNTQQFGYPCEDILDWLKAHGYTQFQQVGIEDLWAT